MEFNQILLYSMLAGGLGGLVRSIIHYVKKVMDDPSVQFDIGKAFWSAFRGLIGAALLGAYREGQDFFTLFLAGLSTEVVYKDLWNYVLGYFEAKKS